MDPKFFEFWGQWFLNIAKGQKHMADTDAWFRQTFKGYEPLASMFKKTYGADGSAQSPPDVLDFWKNTEEAFQKAVRDSLSLLDVVPRKDHLALSSKCASLEKVVAEQEQTIRQLKTLWGQKEDPTASITNDLQTLLSKQEKDFQKMLNTLGLFFQEQKKAPDRKKH